MRVDCDAHPWRARLPGLRRHGFPLTATTAVFDPDEKGGYTVTVPALPGLVTEGDTFEEAKTMVEEAIAGYLES